MTARADSRAAAGAPVNRHLAQVRRAQRGPQVAALFDFDGTIIAGYSATGVLREKFTRGQMSAEEIIGTAAAMTRYWRGRIGFSGLMTSAEERIAGSGRILVRYSGTELLARVMVEGIEKGTVESIAGELAGALRDTLGVPHRRMKEPNA